MIRAAVILLLYCLVFGAAISFGAFLVARATDPIVLHTQPFADNWRMRDGDTWVADDQAYRLAGVDAAECSPKPCDDAATQYLKTLLGLGSPHTCTHRGWSWDRRVVECVDRHGNDIGRMMCDAGLVVNDPDFEPHYEECRDE